MAENPEEPLEFLVATAVVIAVGRVTHAITVAADTDGEFGEQPAVIEVEHTLKGTTTTPLAVHKPRSPYYLDRDAHDGVAVSAGVFLLDDGAPARILGRAGPLQPRRAIERVLAGLPRDFESPTSDDIAKLVAAADLVVEATYASDPLDGAGGVNGAVHVLETLKGDAPAESFHVQRGPLPDEPGGPWEFEPTDGTLRGTVFISTATTPPTVLNLAPPFLYDPRVARQVLDTR